MFADRCLLVVGLGGAKIRLVFRECFGCKASEEKEFSWVIGGTGGEDVEQERRDLDKMVDVGVHHGSRREVQGAELFRSGGMIM